MMYLRGVPAPPTPRSMPPTRGRPGTLPRFLAAVMAVALVAACAPATRTVPVAGEVARQAAGSQTVRAQGPLGLPSEGEASWYGPGFAGRRTANGEVFNPAQLTAAHRTLPFGTLVRVTNLNNGEAVVVRINDRGPFRGNRILDLSRAAAERIRMIGSGTARVRIELVGVGDTPAWSVAVSNRLETYDIVSRYHQIGELLYLASADRTEPVLVRVIGTEIPVGTSADLLVSSDLHGLLGTRVYAAP